MGAVIENLWPDVWRRRYVLRDAGLALLVVATTALVAAVLTDDGSGTATLVTSRSVQPAPLRSPEQIVVESAAPSESRSPVAPAASPTAAVTAVATPSASPSAARTPKPATTSAAPRPAARPATSARPSPPPSYPKPGLRLDVAARTTEDLGVQVTVRVRDTDGSWNGGFIAFGDGQRQDFARSGSGCAARTGPADAKSSDVTRTFRHTYSSSGTYDVVVYVRTERLCSDAPVEDASRTVRVTVTDPSTAEPTPTGSPGEPSPQPSPEQRSSDQRGAVGPRPR